MDTKTLVTVLIALLIGGAFGFIAAPRFGMMGGGGMMNHDMQGMGAMGQPKGSQDPASMAFAKANAAMHQGMNIEFSGNADVDFAKGMIPHHQGAIDMAKILLEHGKDAELRKLAEGVITAQETEIGFMKGWLAKAGQ